MADVRRTGGLARLAGQLRFFTGGPTAAAGTGLRVARAFWGGEVSLRLDDADGGEVSWAFAFTDRTGTRPQLYGYTIDAEGVQLAPDAAALDEFLDGAAADL